MAEFIVEELYVFLVMIAVGAAMSATYDVLRIIRLSLIHIYSFLISKVSDYLSDKNNMVVKDATEATTAAE